MVKEKLKKEFDSSGTISFPVWVAKPSYCWTASRTIITKTPHGVVKSVKTIDLTPTILDSILGRN